LAREYSERGGDIGWFKPEKMVKPFAEAVAAHEYQEIFALNLPSYNWYYVVLKNYPDRITIHYSLLEYRKD